MKVSKLCDKVDNTKLLTYLWKREREMINYKYSFIFFVCVANTTYTIGCIHPLFDTNFHCNREVSLCFRWEGNIRHCLVERLAILSRCTNLNNMKLKKNKIMFNDRKVHTCTHTRTHTHTHTFPSPVTLRTAKASKVDSFSFPGNLNCAKAAACASIGWLILRSTEYNCTFPFTRFCSDEMPTRRSHLRLLSVL